MDRRSGDKDFLFPRNPYQPTPSNNGRERKSDIRPVFPTELLRPTIITYGQSRQTHSVGGSGDISTPVSETVIWANDADHTQFFVDASAIPNGQWFWNQTIFSEFGFPGAASFFLAYGGTTQNGTVQMDIELLDSTLTVLTSSSAVVSYSVDLTTIPGFKYTVSFVSLTYAPDTTANFNAVRVRSTCSNTNLSQLLNYASHGSFPIVGAFVVYPSTSTQIDYIPIGI
jgi:hypothetical protein